MMGSDPCCSSNSAARIPNPLGRPSAPGAGATDLEHPAVSLRTLSSILTPPVRGLSVSSGLSPIGYATRS
jgi:hypothetical protein